MPQDANVLPPPWDIPDGHPITNWDRLHFSPIGVHNLRCWQGVFPGIKDFFITCQSRFRSADIAWFASGMNRDGKHNHLPSSFHPSLVSLVKETSSAQGKGRRKALLAEVQEQLFDTVCFFKSFHLDTTNLLFARQRCMIASLAVPQL
jgi:hypothetical protein